MHLVLINETAPALCGSIGLGRATGMASVCDAARTASADTGAGRVSGSGAAFEAAGSATRAIRRDPSGLAPVEGRTSVSSDVGATDGPAAIQVFGFGALGCAATESAPDPH